MQEIIVEIDERGNVVFEGKGFVGAECDKVMTELESAIGVIVKKDYKPEYRQTRQQGRTVTK